MSVGQGSGSEGEHTSHKNGGKSQQDPHPATIRSKTLIVVKYYDNLSQYPINLKGTVTPDFGGSFLACMSRLGLEA